MFGLIKKIFTGLLTGLVNGCNHTKCVWLGNHNCMTQSTLLNLHPNEYSQEFHSYPFAVKLDRCVGSYNALNELSDKVCQKQPSRGVLKKRCSENMQQIYRRKPMPNCDFNKTAKQLY